jgi:hypothetical protein
LKLDARRSGEALRAAAGDLARIWRASRTNSTTSVFPGVLDGVMDEFLERVAEALLLGEPPEAAWPATRGVVRILPRERAIDALQAEWELTSAVLLSACDALEVDPAAADLVQRAVEAAVQGSGALLASKGPKGILVVHQLAGFRPRTVLPPSQRPP